MKDLTPKEKKRLAAHSQLKRAVQVSAENDMYLDESLDFDTKVLDFWKVLIYFCNEK